MEPAADNVSSKDISHRHRLSFTIAAVVLLLGAILATLLVTSGTSSPPVHKARSDAAHSATPSQPLASVSCPTPAECLAVGGPGRVLVSQDSAKRWTSFSVPTDHYLDGITCPTSSRCVAVGDAGTVLVSNQGARGWRRVKSGTRTPLSAVTCQNPKECVAVGDGGTVLTSRDGGTHWKQTNTGTAVLNGTACSVPDHCVAVTSGADQLLRTTDGKSWSPVDVPGGPLLGLLSMNGVSCSPPTCVSVGADGLVSFSTDNGTSWSFDSAPLTNQTMNAVACSTPTRCTAVGAAGMIFVTPDGGQSWTRVPSPTTETLLGVDCVATGFCVAVGDDGAILSTDAMGQGWGLRKGSAVPTSAPIKVVVVGDSFAHTVALYVGRDASSYGVNLIDGGLDGCSLARGDTLSLPVGGPCSSSGPGWTANYEKDLDQYKPDLVLLALGPWDLSTRLVDGQWLSPGQPAYDAYYAGQLTSAIQILSSQGARVAIATVPYVRTLGPEPCAPPPTTVPNCPTETERVMALDQVARQVAAQAPGHVAVLDLGNHLSPKGRFTQSVDGVVVRAADGVHLSEPGGEWLAPWLLPQLVAAERAPG